MRKNKLLLLLALLMTAATGAWAQSAFTAKEITSASQLTSTDDEAYVAACMPSDFLAVDADVAKAWTGAPTDGSAILIYAIDGNKIKIATFVNGSYKVTTGATWSIESFKNQLTNGKFFYTAAPAPAGYTVSLKDGVKDADKWTISPNPAPEGSPVTIQYTGRLKVKGVKATSDAAPAAASLIVKPEVGQIIGSDGKNYAANATLPDGVTAVAMIAYVGTASDCDHGLAIALEDVSNEQLTWDNSGNNNDSKTAAEWCSAWNTSKAVTGGTWRLPSISDWQYMFIGCGASESYSDNPIQMSYSGLASKLTTAQGDALPVNDDYWSSTVASPDYPWTVLFGDSYAFFGNNTWEGHAFDLVRACLAF